MLRISSIGLFCAYPFLSRILCSLSHSQLARSLRQQTPVGPHVGDWDGVVVPSNRSIVPLPDDFPGEAAPLPIFAKRTVFTNLFPSLQINVTWDCMWWMRLLPLGRERTHICMGFCFPKSTIERPRFEKVFEEYKKRWHIAVSEDNAISLNQQDGLRSKYRKPGRFCQLEFGTHNFNNWLVSKIVDSGERGWDAGRRVHVGKNMWSNDDPKLRRIIKSVDESK